MNCSAYGGRKRRGSHAIAIHPPTGTPRSTRGITRRPPRGIGTLDGRTATPYPARASAISVWGAPLSSSTSGRMFATWQAESNQSREPKSRRRSSSDSSDSSAISMTARRARG